MANSRASSAVRYREKAPGEGQHLPWVGRLARLGPQRQVYFPPGHKPRVKVHTGVRGDYPFQAIAAGGWAELEHVWAKGHLNQLASFFPPSQHDFRRKQGVKDAGRGVV